MSEQLGLTRKQAKELANKIKVAVMAAADHIRQAGRMLIEFKEGDGWKALGYDSWSACIEQEFQSEHGDRSRIFRLIQHEEVMEIISENGSKSVVSPTESTNVSREFATTRSVPMSHTEQLARLPAAKQRETYEKAISDGNGKPTAGMVKKAVDDTLEIMTHEPAPVPKAKAEKPVKIIVRDETGYAIPDSALPLWNRRQEVKDILRAISTARAALKVVMDARKDGEEDMLFAAANINGAWGKLSDAWTTVGMALPYAVCPTCQGRAPDNCLLCKGRAFISKHIYDCAVSVELKEIRSKSCVS